MTTPIKPKRVPRAEVSYEPDARYHHAGAWFTGWAVSSRQGVTEEQEFRNGFRWGSARVHNAAGTLIMESNFRMDLLHGAQREWDDAGGLLLEAWYEHGVLLEEKQWDGSGGLISRQGPHEVNPHLEEMRRLYGTPEQVAEEEAAFLARAGERPEVGELPHGLRQRLDQARVQVLAHESSDLPRPTRIQLQLAMGPHLRSPGVGLTRRANLCLLVVKKVQPIWERHYPELPASEAVQDMIRLTEQCLRSEITRKEARRGRGGLMSVLLDADAEPVEKQPALSAGEAATRAVYVAMHDEDADQPELLDDDLDATDWDCAFWGACAWSGAIPGHDGWNQEAYKEFWLWYLDEAVPEAWASATEVGPT